MFFLCELRQTCCTCILTLLDYHKTKEINAPLAGCAPKLSVGFLLEKFPVDSEDTQWISYSYLSKKITTVSEAVANE